MSNVSSEQSCVHEGVGYNKVFPLGQGDPSTSNSKRVPSANSPFVEEDEDLDVDGSESDSNDDLADAEPLIQSVIGPDGLREFIMLPVGKFRPRLIELTSFKSKLLIRFIMNKTC